MSSKRLRLNINDIQIPRNSKVEITFAVPVSLTNEDELTKICDKELLSQVYILRDDHDIHNHDPLERILTHSITTMDKDHIENYLTRVDKTLRKFLNVMSVYDVRIISDTPFEFPNFFPMVFLGVAAKYTRGGKDILRVKDLSKFSTELGMNRLLNYFQELTNYRIDSDPVEIWNAEFEIMVYSDRVSHYKECLKTAGDLLKKYYETKNIEYKLKVI